ncbi:MAG: hypothetical protein AB7D00_06410 [Rhodospirillaceae bacterium]
MGSPTNTLLAALSRDACLTVAELVAASGLDNRVVVKAAAQLIGRGLADRAEVGCFTLTAEGEAFRASGKEVTSGPKGPLTQSYRRARRTTLRDRLWAALRVRRKASIPELLELASNGEAAALSLAQKYTSALCRSGHLRELRRDPGTAPTSNGFKRFALIRDTGPEAPLVRVRAREVYDPNTGETYPLGGAQ